MLVLILNSSTGLANIFGVYLPSKQQAAPLLQPGVCKTVYSPSMSRNLEAAALALSQGQALLLEGPPGQLPSSHPKKDTYNSMRQMEVLRTVFASLDMQHSYAPTDHISTQEGRSHSHSTHTCNVELNCSPQAEASFEKSQILSLFFDTDAVICFGILCSERVAMARCTFALKWKPEFKAIIKSCEIWESNILQAAGRVSCWRS